MIMLVLFSNIAGLILKEWRNCSMRTRQLLVFALLVLIAAVIILTYGNYISQA
jgi:L-rhamnose-H+ transport protein